jgi:GTP-binding protein
MKNKSPVISIIGIPNTGKSTLFNRLVQKRKALVHSLPGMTRDVIKATMTIKDNQYNLQDTGGFFDDAKTINQEINKKVIKVSKESDLIIFLFDSKRDLLGFEKDLYLEIKKTNQNILHVMNKIDNPSTHFMPPSYYCLKADFILISADHNIGIGNLLDRIQEQLSDCESKTELPVEATKISFIGKPNVGKSSLINKLLNEDKIIVTPLPGTTRDSVEYELHRNNKVLQLVDNAGIRKMQKIQESTEKAAVIRAKKNIKNTDIILFILDISSKITREDMTISSLVVESHKPVIIVCNKWDLIQEKQDATHYHKKIRRRFNKLPYATIVFTSAVSKKGLFSILDHADRISENRSKDIKTSYLNKLIKDLVNEKKLYTVNNKRFDPKYCVIESRAPFFIRFYVTSVTRLKPHSEKYLKNRIRESLGVEGIPIFFKTIHNEK